MMTIEKGGVKMDDSIALYLFHEGNYFQSYEFFGSHIANDGVEFRLWAPNAQKIYVVGDFNNWNTETHPMHLMKDSGGVWETKIPNLKQGDVYKYFIVQENGAGEYKADPYAFYAEVKPKTASVIWDICNYNWKDGKWLAKREKEAQNPKPVNIYELHLGSWKRNGEGDYLTYLELRDELIPYLKEMHYTHVEFMPVMEHPFDGSWGYQLTGFFAPTSRYGTPQELMALIDALHLAGIAVIFDWVPGHFCKDAHGLYQLDGTMLYESCEHPHWGTMEFDFGRPEVVNFLVSNAYYWFKEYHIDGIRVDGVESMLYLNYGYADDFRRNKNGGKDNLEAVAFLQRLNIAIFKNFPFALMAAEESTAYPMVSWPVSDGGLGFNQKWDMGWMHDTLEYLESDPYYRHQFHSKLTFSMAYAFSENFVLPLSHDEVVHGKKTIIDKLFGSYEMKFSQIRLLYAYMFTHPGKKLLFMGNEFAPFMEWRYYESLEWFLLDYPKHREVQELSKAINKLYLKENALWYSDHSWEGFQWIDADNASQSILIFRRMGKTVNDDLIVIINFCPIYYGDFKVGVPKEATYRLIFNTDQVEFGGEGHKVKKSAKSKDGAWHNQDHYINVNIPPSSALLYKAVVSKK